MNRLKLYVWIEGSDERPDLPPDFSIEPVSSSDSSSVPFIVVPLEGLSSFIGRAPVDEEGRKPPAILFLRREESKPENAYPYFDDFIVEGEWDRLRRYAVSPRALDVISWTSAIPPDLLDRIPANSSRKDIDNLPLPVEIRELISSDDLYQEVFNEAIADQIAVRWQVRKPSVSDLAEYVRGRLSPHVEPYILSHLERSAPARAQFSVLQRELLGDLATVELPPTRTARDEIPPDLWSLVPVTVGALSIGLMASHYVLRQKLRYRGRVSSPEFDPADIMAAISSSESAHFDKGDYGFDVHFEPSNQSVQISSVTARGERRNFFVLELKGDDGSHLSRPSVSGSAMLDLKEMGDMLSRGAVTLSIRTA